MHTIMRGGNTRGRI